MSRLVKCWPAIKGGITLTVYTSHCIVTRPPEHTTPTSRIYFQPITLENPVASTAPIITRALVNPANEELIGTVLPYFPMAGPPPEELFTTNWGGASAGSGMFYSMQSVDGIVTLHGGDPLRKACKELPVHKNVELIGGGGNKSGTFGSVRCPVGSAVITKAFGRAVTKHYQYIVHAVPPLWTGIGGSKLSEGEATFLLRSCYYEAFKTGFVAGAAIVTSPLIGVGARSVPVPTAIDCAVKGVLNAMIVCGYRNSKLENQRKSRNLKDSSVPLPPIAAEIVVLDPWIAVDLVNAIDHELDVYSAS